MRVAFRRLSVFFVLCFALFCTVFSSSDSVLAIAKQSSLTLQIVPDVLTTSITPTPEGTFGKTSSSTISVSTDNFTGYSLSIKSQDSTSLLNSNDDAIESISTAISEATFSSDNTYNNKWGYQPSQYVTTSGGVNTTVSNSNYLPAPSTTGDLLAVTNAANVTADQYTLVAGARVDGTLPADTYEYTYVLMAVANSVVYNITYDDFTAETVTNMPSPNPQALEIDGGTPVAQSYGTLSIAVPTMTSDDMSFGGWCTVQTTLNTVTHNYECIGGTTYQPGDSYPIDQTVDGTNITLYAIWIEDFFPMVWSQMGKCVFTSTQTGTDTYDGDVSGPECSEYAGNDYIDTGIALYSNDNYQKDYEVHFVIDTFNPNAQLENQATMFNDKLSSSVTESPYGGKSPGAVVRLTSSHAFEIKSTYGAPTDHAVSRIVTKTPYATAYDGTDVRIFRINGHIYTSVDNGPLTELQNYTSFNQQFGLTAWFGAYPDNVDCTENCTAAKRFFTGEMSNMYIKLGDFPADGMHTITFDANGGTPATTDHLILDGNALAELPEVTQSGWFFDGWWTASSGGQQVSASTVPTASTTYYAHWYKSVTDAQIVNTSVALSLNGTETITITNASDIEPYTLASSDTSVVTVDSSGVITAVANGAATITMTGTKTGDTRTISVSVGSSYTINFDSQGGTPATYQESVGDGGSFSSLPEPTYPGYEFEGWYTGTNGTGTQLTTSTVFDSNTPTQYYAYWTQIAYVCKVATTQHSEQCSRSSGGCRGAGWAANAQIDYGYLITDSSPVTAGAAYDCDVDFDGTYDPDTERFYYFGTENGNAKLIYYKNMANNASVPYADALALLPNYELDANNPSVPVWDNPNLVTHTTGDYAGKAARFMTYPEVTNGLYSGSNNHITPSDPVSTYLFEQSNFTVTTRTDGIWLEQQTDGQGNITYVNRIQTSSRTLTHGAVGATSANASRPTIDVPTQYIEPFTPSTYNITFNPHNETASWTETIDVGDDLTDVYPATDPTYADHLFQGWFTAASGGTQISSSTVPSGDTEYHARWLGTVVLATLSSNSISVAKGSTATITVTNASDIENYGFSSLDSSVATVDPSTGVVTGVNVGTTSIRITGATSLLYIDVPVTVTAPVPYTITFNPHNETASWTETVIPGDSLGTAYPATEPTYTDHLFQGWFTAASGGTQISSATQPSGDTEYHAQWLKTVALANLGSNSLTIAEGDTEVIVVTNSAELEGYSFSSLDTSVATVDSSTGIVTGVAEGTTTVRMTGATSGAYKDIIVVVTPPQTITTLCRLAVAGSLHTATRTSDDTPLEYGQIASSSTPQPGDAYDCDVNNDDNYNATNERFYYLGQDGNNNAVLVAWNSYYSGDWASGNSGDNVYNYANALLQLPSNAAGEWDHPGLIEQDTGKAARFMNYSEVVAACPGVSVGATQSLVTCDFLMEHSAYDDGGRSALWLNYDGSTYRRIHAGDTNRNVITVSNANNSNNMVRPAIVVPYDLIEKYVVPQVTVTFNSMGGSSVAQATFDEGLALGTNYPSTDPTKTDNKFFGWYTDTTYTTEVTPDTVVNSDVTYYARWIGDTANFPIEWAEINECDFNGASNLSGTYCTQPKDKSYINTGIKLFSAYGLDVNDLTANFDKDFEVGFTIIEFDRTKQTNTQASVVNSKLEDTGYPGFVFRRNNSVLYQLTAKFPGAGNPTTSDPVNNPVSEGSLKHVRIVKRGNKMYYAWNGGQLIEWWDITGFSTKFETEVWFGAIDDGTGSPDRRIVGKLTDMYIRIGTYEEAGAYTIQFDANGGTITSGSSIVTIDQGDSINAFPTVTRGNFTLVGWYDENDNPVTTSTVPNRSQTYHAVWQSNSSKTPVTFDVSNAAVTGYDTIVKSYAPQITTFNEADPINNSTWGVAKTTYLGDLQTNFETNNCMAVPQEDSQIDWGGNHTVNCSKPSAFDTGVSTGVDVYEYDIANDTVIGTALTYTKSSGGVIHNLIPGHDYYWEDSSDSSVYGVISAVSSASNRRLLDVGNVWNVRDLGGLPVDSDGDGTVDGTIEYGKLIRGGRLNTTSSNITELQNLGVDKEYDLAGSGELSPDVQFGTGSYVNDEVIHYNFDYGTIVDNEDTYAMARQAVTDIMNDVINNNNIYFHCRVGADRTGTVAYILEGLLGVPDEERYRDYELTSVSGLNDRTRYYAQKSSTNNKKFIFMMGYVQTTADIVAWYLKDTNDTGAQARIAAFKQAMIISSGGGSGQQNSPQNAPAQQQMSPLSIDYSNGSDVSNTGTNTDTASGDESASGSTKTSKADNEYKAPLGVSNSTDSTISTDTISDSSPIAGIAAAAAATAVVGVTMYAVANHVQNKE